MSEEDDITTPAPAPVETESPLLQPEESSMGDLLVPGLIAVAGAALLYTSVSKRKKKASDAKKPVADSGEVKFSKNYSTYSVGKSWRNRVLEPFLAEQAEENNLITSDYMNNTVEGLTMEQLVPLMDESRKNTLAIFRATHKVATPDGDVSISKLPSGKTGVKKFISWLDDEAKEFQENY